MERQPLNQEQFEMDPNRDLGESPLNTATPRAVSPGAPQTEEASRRKRDAVFTSEAAFAFDKGVVAKFDNVNIVRSVAEDEIVPDVPHADEHM